MTLDVWHENYVVQEEVSGRVTEIPGWHHATENFGLIATEMNDGYRYSLIVLAHRTAILRCKNHADAAACVAELAALGNWNEAEECGPDEIPMEAVADIALRNDSMLYTWKHPCLATGGPIGGF